MTWNSAGSNSDTGDIIDNKKTEKKTFASHKPHSVILHALEQSLECMTELGLSMTLLGLAKVSDDPS